MISESDKQFLTNHNFKKNRRLDEADNKNGLVTAKESTVWTDKHKEGSDHGKNSHSAHKTETVKNKYSNKVSTIENTCVSTEVPINGFKKKIDAIGDKNEIVSEKVKEPTNAG